MRSYQKKQTFKPNKKSKPCVYCGEQLKGAAIRLSSTVFEDGEVYKSSYTSCVKCDLEKQEKDKWIEERRKSAMDGKCVTMERKMYSWSDGSLYGGKCQYQCHNCEAMCTWGDVGSF